MAHGRCLCVCCMCSVMREGMCEKKNSIGSVMRLMVWLGVTENVMETVML